MNASTNKLLRWLLGDFERRPSVPNRVADALGGEFSKHERRELDRLGTLIHFETGSALTTEGRIGREAFVVAAGSAEVTRHGEVIATLGAGEVFGEAALINSQPRNATVTARTPLAVFVVNPAELSSLMSACPHLDRSIRDLSKQRSA